MRGVGCAFPVCVLCSCVWLLAAGGFCTILWKVGLGRVEEVCVRVAAVDWLQEVLVDVVVDILTSCDTWCVISGMSFVGVVRLVVFVRRAEGRLKGVCDERGLLHVGSILACKCALRAVVVSVCELVLPQSV